MASAAALQMTGASRVQDAMWAGRTGRGVDPSASVSSTSITSPLVSSHGDVSEAESYATRGAISGVETNHDEDEDEGSNKEAARSSSELLRDSDDEDNDAAAQVDSLADASPEEVQARVCQVLGWNDVGADRELPAIDLKRWSEITPQHSQEGTPEYGQCAFLTFNPRVF